LGTYSTWRWIGLRLLQLISEKPPVKSGFARTVDRLAEELAKMGHEVKVLSAQDCCMKQAGEVKLIISMRRLEKELRGGYDVVNIHGHTPMFSDRLLLLSRLFGMRVVYTLHCLANYYLKPLSSFYNLLLNRAMLRLADAVVVTSRSYYDMIPGWLNKHIIPLGVDSEAFRGERVPHSDYRILFVGQMRPYKGLKLLLKAVEGLDLTLNIVGDGPDRRSYEEYARRLRKVRFHGAVPDEALRRLYLESDVLVLPSFSMNEAFGLVTLEAAAAGCVVVASNLPGVRDLVGEFGLLVDPGDPSKLREAILKLRDESARKRYVEMGMKAAACYSWRRTAEQYDKIYREIS
jgi:rhamnosyl/mannosyltransferase